MVGCVLLVFAKVFGFLSLGFIPGGSSNPQGRFLFFFQGFFPFFLFYFCFMDLKLTLSSTPFFLSACRMTRGHKEVSTS